MRLLHRLLRKLANDFCLDGSRGARPIKVLQKVLRISFHGRFLEKARQLIALGALSFFGDALPTIAGRLDIG